MVENNKQTFQDFYDTILISSQSRGIMVLLRKSCPFKLFRHKDVTSNCLSVLLKSASNQDLKIAFVYNPNDETDKIGNLSKAFDHLASNGCKKQLIIGDYNTSLNPELNYLNYSEDPNKASRDFLHGLQANERTDSGTPMILATPGKSTTLKNDQELAWLSPIKILSVELER